MINLHAITIEISFMLIPRIRPITLVGVLFTILGMFFLKDASMVPPPLDAARIARPLTILLSIVFFSSFYLAGKLDAEYSITPSLSSNSASNDFEPGIAVAMAFVASRVWDGHRSSLGGLTTVLTSLVNAALNFNREYFARLKYTV